jgi:hypothetical protein
MSGAGPSSARKTLIASIAIYVRVIGREGSPFHFLRRLAFGLGLGKVLKAGYPDFSTKRSGK